MIADPQFVERRSAASEDLTPIAYGDVEEWVQTLAGTPPEAIDYIASMLRWQGIRVE
jgi:hypothetical protein